MVGGDAGRTRGNFDDHLDGEKYRFIYVFYVVFEFAVLLR